MGGEEIQQPRTCAHCFVNPAPHYTLIANELSETARVPAHPHMSSLLESPRLKVL
jgi:hypothetical protein